MAGRFDAKAVEELLVACHRRCCVCHRFCGVKMEIDHIVPGAEGGLDTIDNAIPLCFECHAEVHSYNDKHPRGRKFKASELRAHKEQWLRICREQPQLLISAPVNREVGPLQALIDELDFNLAVVPPDPHDVGCAFSEEQFRRAISAGAVSVLDEDLKNSLLDAYAAIGRANQVLHSVYRINHSSPLRPNALRDAHALQRVAEAKIEAARTSLLRFLGSDSA